MAQTEQAVFIQADGTVDFTTSSAIAAGDVIVRGLILGIAKQAYAANTLATIHTRGQFRVKKKTGAIVVGAIIFWDIDGSPVSGTASSGAASPTRSSGDLILGKALAAQASGDETVDIEMYGYTS
jgi:predicted RecA/RadA family phage recombinase